MERSMTNNPYKRLPDHCFWRRSVSETPLASIDPVVTAKFLVKPSDRIATAGSCFAQHIARHLRQSGFHFLITEPAHPILDLVTAEKFNYGVFTARYGNLYTTRQLLQLLQRAHGAFSPVDDVWQGDDGRFYDPYRPNIQPNGFPSIHEYMADRAQHFAAVRRAVRELDVFVFTLGLTEAWMNREDGAVYPVVPGAAAGQFDPARHVFANFSAKEVAQDLKASLLFIQRRNPGARFILTVSPVPLVATYCDRSVITSTVYSKSVLRVACEEIESQMDAVAYFPSYEIITGNFTRGEYFAADLRSVTEAGVAHVMRLFMRHYTNDRTTKPDTTAAEMSDDASARFEKQLQGIVAVMCDEESLAEHEAAEE
jgi:GSCFA family protein